jgi:hypothetical protein
MCGACGRWVRERNAFTVWWENLKEINHLEELIVGGRISKWILKK